MTIGQEHGLIFCNSGMLGGFTHGFPIHLLGLIHHLEGGFDLFLGLVEVLLLKSLKRRAEFGPGSGMRDHAEILRNSAAQIHVVDTVCEGAFILFDRFREFSLLLGINAPIEELDRIDGFVFAASVFRNRSPAFRGTRIRRRRDRRILRKRLSFVLRSLRLNRKHGERAEKHRRCRAAGTNRPIGKSEPDQHQHKGDGQRIAEPVDRLCGLDAFIVLRRKGADALFQGAESRIARSRTHIDAAGPFCQRAERGLVERTVHNVSLSIFEGFQSAASIRNLNDGGLGGIADSGDEERNFAGDDFIDGFSAVTFQFISIGNEHDGAMLGFRRFECLKRRFQRGLNIGSAHWNGCGGKLVHGLKKTGFIGGQGTLQKSASGKGNESEAVPGILLHQLPDQPFGMRKTRRLNIFCQHGS